MLIRLDAKTESRVKELRRIVKADLDYDVIRNALALYDYLVTLRQRGVRIVVREGDQESEVFGVSDDGAVFLKSAE